MSLVQNSTSHRPMFSGFVGLVLSRADWTILYLLLLRSQAQLLPDLDEVERSDAIEHWSDRDTIDCVSVYDTPVYGAPAGQDLG